MGDSSDESAPELQEVNESAEVVSVKREIIPVNNVPALEAKLKNIQLNLDWVEKLDTSVKIDSLEMSVDSKENSNAETPAESDFKREMSFYNQAMASVSKAFKRLKKLGIPTKRPDDFFAEMAKSDAHMTKVREKLLSKKIAIERTEKVRALREQKKHGKKIQQEILEQKRSEKKKMINALKKTKKGKMDVSKLLGEKKEMISKPKGKKSREFRDNKYGYGGKKRGSKWNTAESSAFYPGKQSNVQKNKFSKKQNRSKPRPKKHRRRR